MDKYGLLINYDFCTGCHSCEIACQQEHDFPVGKNGIRVTEYEYETFTKLAIDYLPYPTELCDLCMRQCPIEIRIAQCEAGKPPSGDPNQCPPRHAITLEPVADGPARIPVIGDGCVGCGVCEMICPVDPTVIVIDLDRTADTLNA